MVFIFNGQLLMIIIILNYIQISISEPFYISPKFRSNQTEIFLSNNIQLNKQYHICLILLHKYSHDKYCREILTDKLIIHMIKEIILKKMNIQKNPQYDINLIYDINWYMYWWFINIYINIYMLLFMLSNT